MEEAYKINPLLVRKYNQPVSKYSSYPTLPFWDKMLTSADWFANFKKEFNNNNHKEGISIYIHLPFCESLCNHCGWNNKITTDHDVEEEYLLAIEKEWKLYKNGMQQTPVIREIHIGGGTPTFFSPKNLQRLLTMILKKSIVHPVYEFSIEAHPNNTTHKHLEVLYAHGFRNITFGVQDNDPEVQRIINRIQPFDNLQKATQMAREAGFTSIGFELMYGLPKQTIKGLQNTIEQVTTLLPERIAYISYNHVPWINQSQQVFDKKDLPSAEEKISMYLPGREMLMNLGYFDIGMDHFALEKDSLYKAWQKGRLHRNFTGYSAQYTGILVGLGVSAISDTGTALAQNTKSLPDYYSSLNNNQLAIKKGYILNDEDILFRKNITAICCKGKTSFNESQTSLLEQYTFPALDLFVLDGLITYNKEGLEVTRQGHFFIRNICSAFDMHLQKNKNISDKDLFSKAI